MYPEEFWVWWKKQIRDEDFIGSVYDMEYIIRKENLGKGRNFGRIRIRTVYGEKIYEVMASKAGKIQVNVNAYEKKKKLELMRALLDFRMKKISMESWVKKYPTPFHIYDAEAIRENARRLLKAFSWNKGFREYFAVKAAPNPELMRLLKEFNFGSDCSSMAELVLAEKVP